MPNRKIFVYILFGFFIVSLVGTAYFSYMLWLKPKSQTNIEIKPVTNSQEDSIVKFISDERNVVTYEIEGEFFTNLEKSGETNLLVGGFVVKGDTYNNIIPVYIGTLDGNIYLGRHETSFRGNSSWKIEPTNTLIQSTKIGDPVKLSVEYSSKETGEERFAANSLSKSQDILDKLSSAIKKGDKYVVPVDFTLSAYKIGIVK